MSKTVGHRIAYGPQGKRTDGVAIFTSLPDVSRLSRSVALVLFFFELDTATSRVCLARAQACAYPHFRRILLEVPSGGGFLIL